ncbi:hypothetical protein B0H11DRAFT_2286294 [Mycena galericulata]|nr:hypothetical protein B0H11DRAFT_2286294 [Mycena galericulata]
MSRGIAAVTWGSTDRTEIRVYFQKEDLAIYEMQSGPSEKWFRGNEGDPICSDACRETPLAAIYISGEIHVFYVQANGSLGERKCVGGSWVDGSIPLRTAGVYEKTGLAAVVTHEATYRIYYQEKSGDIVELEFRNPDWHAGPTLFNNAKRGTGIAVANAGGASCTDLHLVYARSDSHSAETSDITEWHYVEGSWSSTGRHSPYALVNAEASLACVSLTSATAGATHFKMLFFADPRSSRLQEVDIGGEGGAWVGPNTLSDMMTAPGGSPIAAVAYRDEGGLMLYRKVFVMRGEEVMTVLSFGSSATWAPQPEWIDWSVLSDYN